MLEQFHLTGPFQALNKEILRLHLDGLNASKGLPLTPIQALQ